MEKALKSESINLLRRNKTFLMKKLQENLELNRIQKIKKLNSKLNKENQKTKKLDTTPKNKSNYKFCKNQ